MNESPERRPRPKTVSPNSPLKVRRPTGQRLPWRLIFPLVFVIGILFGVYVALATLIPSGTAAAATATPTPLAVSSPMRDPYDPGTQAALPVPVVTARPHGDAQPVPTLPPNADVSQYTTGPQTAAVPGINSGVVIARTEQEAFPTIPPTSTSAPTTPTATAPPTTPPIIVPFITPSSAPAAPATEDPGSAAVAEQAVKDIAGVTSAHNDVPSVSPYTIQQGTYIRVRPLGTINTQFGCAVTAMVVQDYYDSVNQEYLLIPAGTKVIESCKSGAVYGQNRVFLVATRLIYPSGASRILDLFPATDDAGSLGVNANVDQHIGNLAGPAVLLSALESVAQLSTGGQSYGVSGQAQTPAQIEASSLTQQLDQLGIALTQRALAQAPTLSVPVAEPYNIEVMNDMVFTAPYSPEGVKR